MDDPLRRLRLVTEAAYSGSDDAAEASAAASDAPAPQHVGEAEEPSTAAPQGWTEPERSHRWGTPALLAARVGVVILVLAAAAATSIVLTRPSAPVHQPDLPLPDPPEEWVAGPGHISGDVSANAGAGSAPGEGGTEADGGSGAAGPGSTHPMPAPADTGQEPGGAAQAPGGAQHGSAPEDQRLIVHVAGQVHEPGIVDLPATARVHDALTAAGGPTADADVAAVNLAAPVTDGQQIYLPAHGEEPPTGPGPPAHAGGEPSTQDLAALQPVDLNGADATTLQTLPGIGPAMAERILAHRRDHGPFNSVEDLMAVSGIGPATLTRLRDLVTVTPPP